MKSINESYFLELTSPFCGLSNATQSLSMSLKAESTIFIRFNNARIRQTGTVEDAVVSLRYQERDSESSSEIRESVLSVNLCGDLGTDRLTLRSALDILKDSTRNGAIKPFATWPTRGQNSSFTHPGAGSLPSALQWPSLVLPPVQGLDFTGILASGRIIRASRNSLSLFHWFETECATLDYSIISPNGKAVKSEFLIPTPFSTQAFEYEFANRIQSERKTLSVLSHTAIKLKPGEVRCFLGPSAVCDLVQMFSWGCVSEDSIRQGLSPLRLLRTLPSEERKSYQLSPKFSLVEDFEHNALPRFNDSGEVAPSRLELIAQGELRNTWVSSKTAAEWGLPPNGATQAEGLRAPSVLPGKLPIENAMKALHTGVYLPNLHYLNWSDQPAGRITGMTRHACLWVENGEPVAPIENMRWDENLFRVFGSELEDLTQERSSIPDTGSYDYRALGSSTVPGALLRSFRLTL